MPNTMTSDLNSLDLNLNPGVVTNLEPLVEQVEGIESKIPEEATSDNKLADKAYVNNQVATNTATFRGSYNLVTDLGLTVAATQQETSEAIATYLSERQIDPENNDYVFVQIPFNETPVDPTHIERVDRYKYTIGELESSWEYEFSLNNSTFTQAQWDAINSGMTAALTQKLNGIASGAQVNVIESIKVNGTAIPPVNKSVNISDIPKAALDSAVQTSLGKAETAVQSGDIADLRNKFDLGVYTYAPWTLYNRSTPLDTFTWDDSSQSYKSSQPPQMDLKYIADESRWRLYVPGPSIVFYSSEPFDTLSIALDIATLSREAVVISDDTIAKVSQLPNLSPYAPLNSPAFAGTPTAPTPAQSDSSGKIATTEFVRYDLKEVAELTLEDRAVQMITLSAASTTLVLPALTSDKTSDFVLDVVNNYAPGGTPSAANFILAGTIGTTYNIVVPEGEDWSEMSALEAGEMAEYYFTLSAFALGGLPTWKIVKQTVGQYMPAAVTP